MVVRLLFLAALFPLFLFRFRYSWDEGLLLLLASLFFFGVLFNRLRLPAAEFFVARLEEIYSSFAILFFSKLNRLDQLLSSGYRLFSSVVLFSRLSVGFFISLLTLPLAPAIFLLAVSVKRRFLARLLSFVTVERKLVFESLLLSSAIAGLAVERELALRFATRKNN